MDQESKRVITKMMLESRYTRVNSYQQERERRKAELQVCVHGRPNVLVFLLLSSVVGVAALYM